MLLLIEVNIEGGIFGSQGDVWNAQKDMLCNTSGAISSLVVFYSTSKKCFYS